MYICVCVCVMASLKQKFRVSGVAYRRCVPNNVLTSSLTIYIVADERPQGSNLMQLFAYHSYMQR